MTSIPEVPWDVAREAPGIEIWARQLEDWFQDNLPTIPEQFSLSEDIQDALTGNEGQPSIINRFVTEEGLAQATQTINTTTTVIVTGSVPLTTRGDLLTRDAVGNVRLGIGANATYLRSNGTDPSWQAIASADIVNTTFVTSVSGTATRISSSGGLPPVIDLVATAVTANPYGSATQVGTFTVDAYGRLTAAANVAIALDASAITSGTLAIARGGTNSGTALGAFNNLSPLTTRGDLLTRDATNNVRLAIGTVGKYVRTDGTDPSWSALLASDLSGVVAIVNGGTGQITTTLAFNALSPLTTRGDLLTRDGTNNIRLAIGTVAKYLRSDGTDPSWQIISTADLTTTLTGLIQGTGSGAMAGITGTANYFPKWSATAQYLTATSNLYDDGTDVIHNSAAAVAWGSSGIATPDVFLRRNSAGWWEQYNSTNAQSFSLYGTRTDASNYERLTVKHNGSSSGISITSEALGSGTARHFVFTGARVGIGTATSLPLDLLHIIGDGVNAGFRLDGYGANASVDVRMAFERANGTKALPTIVSNADDLMRFKGLAHDGTTFQNTTEFRASVDGVPAAGAGKIPGRMTFWTADGAGLFVERLRIDHSGNIGIGATSFGTSMAGGLAMLNATAPSGNVTDCYQLYAADQVAGNSSPHFRTENGGIIKIFRNTGWTLPTGTAAKGGWDTSTGTLTNALQTIKAIMDHLMTGAGFFGT